MGSSGLGRTSSSMAGPVKVRRPGPEIGLELVQAPVDVEARVPGVVAFPDGHRCAPEPVARYRPIAGAFEPFTKRAVAYVSRHPVYLLVQFQHRVLERPSL